MPKITTFLNEAQQFVRDHEVTSITFFVSVMLTTIGRGGTEKDFNERQMTKEELLSLTPAWVEKTMRETAEIADKYFRGVDNSDAK